MLHEIPYPYFSPLSPSKRKMRIGRQATHPLNHYKFYYSPHIIHGFLKAIHNTDIMVIQSNCNIT